MIKWTEQDNTQNQVRWDKISFKYKYLSQNLIVKLPVLVNLNSLSERVSDLKKDQSWRYNSTTHHHRPPPKTFQSSYKGDFYSLSAKLRLSKEGGGREKGGGPKVSRSKGSKDTESQGPKVGYSHHKVTFV